MGIYGYPNYEYGYIWVMSAARELVAIYVSVAMHVPPCDVRMIEMLI